MSKYQQIELQLGRNKVFTYAMLRSAGASTALIKLDTPKHAYTLLAEQHSISDSLLVRQILCGLATPRVQSACSEQIKRHGSG